MKKNMGSFDRAFRLIVAVIIAVLYFTDIIAGAFGIVLLIVGAILLLTSFIGTCPAYLPIGFNTCKMKEE